MAGKTFPGVGELEDQPADPADAADSGATPAPSASPFYSGPTVVDDVKVEEGLQKLRALDAPPAAVVGAIDTAAEIVESGGHQVPFYRPAPGQPSLHAPLKDGGRGTYIGHSVTEGVPPAQPEKPYDNRMRGTLFGHMLHLPELKLPAPEEPSSRELTIVDQSAPTSQALEIYQPQAARAVARDWRDGRRRGFRRRPRRFRGRTATAASRPRSTPGRTTRSFSGWGSPRRRSPRSLSRPSSGCTPAPKNPSCSRDPQPRPRRRQPPLHRRSRPWRRRRSPRPLPRLAARPALRPRSTRPQPLSRPGRRAKRRARPASARAAWRLDRPRRPRPELGAPNTGIPAPRHCPIAPPPKTRSAKHPSVEDDPDGTLAPSIE